jgi:hypothetical protein
MPRRAFALALLLVTTGRPLPAQTTAVVPPRTDLEDLRSALEAAVARTGRPGFFHPAEVAGHAYRLKGYGAIIVLAPRAFPRQRAVVRRMTPAPRRHRAAGATSEPRIVIEIPEGTFDVAIPDLGDLQREMEAQMAVQAAALREMESTQRNWTRGREEELRAFLHLVEEQAEAFRREAERARRQMEREVWTRLAPPALPARPAPPRRAAPPVPAVAPDAPDAPDVPDVPDAADAPDAPEPPEPPPPPWRFWFDEEGEPQITDTDPQAFVAAVREAVAAGLESYRRPLSSFGPDDVVTVAVDFIPDRLFRKPPTRTLLVRARAHDLQDRRAGRLTAAALRQRLEFEEN